MNGNKVGAALAIMAMVTFMLAFFALGWMEVPATNKDFLNQALIALIGFVGTAFGFYLGTAFVGKKTETVATAIPAEPLKPITGEGGFIRYRLLLPLAFLLILAGSLWSLYGCAATRSAENWQLTAGKSLLGVKSAIVTAAATVDALCESGQLTMDTCQGAKAVYNQARPAYDSAVDAYLLVQQGQLDQETFYRSLSKAQSLATSLQGLTGGAK